MRDDQPHDEELIVYRDVSQFVRDVQRGGWDNEREPVDTPPRYRLALGRERLQLGLVEFRILTFLAARPYHAYTRRQIAEAAGTEIDPLTEDTVDGRIASLRDQLGLFKDYIQSVPYIGYRFKE